jgi:hypothetical protein
MNREAAFGATVKQQQARGQTVSQADDYQSRELLLQHLPFQLACGEIPSVSWWRNPKNTQGHFAHPI